MQRRISALTGPGSQRHVRLLLIVVLLAGVLGMHALSLHGQPVPGTTGRTLLSVPGLDGPGHHAHPAGPARGHVGPTMPAGGGDHDHGLAELCLAVLIAVTVAAAAGRLRRLAPGVRRRNLLPRRVDLPAGRPRARGPSVTTLCLLRC